MTYPSKLQETKVKTIKSSDCKGPSQKPDWTITESTICTKTTDKSTCYGDSGGPLTYVDPMKNKHTLVGIVSYEYIYCDSKDPQVHGRITSVCKWIRMRMRGLTCQG